MVDLDPQGLRGDVWLRFLHLLVDEGSKGRMKTTWIFLPETNSKSTWK